MSGCKYVNPRGEVCGDDSGRRPYAQANRKERVPSTTAIAELLDDGKSRSFAWAASGITASVAVHSPQLWAHLPTEGCTHDKEGFCPACRLLRSEFDRQWQAKAALGGHVHHLIESMIRGEDVEQDERTEPYLDAFEKFCVDCEPEFVVAEATVLYDANPSHRYRGQTDGFVTVTIPTTRERKAAIIDWKTGQHYPVSQTLQLCGYVTANWLTDWSTGDEVKVGPVPKVETGAVVLLSGDGQYRLVELPIFGNTFGTFLRLVDAWYWLNRDMRSWIKADPN